MAVFVGKWWFERGSVSYLFDLDSVPWSVSSVECESMGYTDTLYTCAFEIDPEDFPRLLVGESYILSPALYYQAAHQFPMSGKLGPNFSVAWHYSAVPKNAPYGGSIDVFADQSKHRVLAHLYIE
jgi:hypothetical protein